MISSLSDDFYVNKFWCYALLSSKKTIKWFNETLSHNEKKNTCFLGKKTLNNIIMYNISYWYLQFLMWMMLMNSDVMIYLVQKNPLSELMKLWVIVKKKKH